MENFQTGDLFLANTVSINSLWLKSKYRTNFETVGLFVVKEYPKVLLATKNGIKLLPLKDVLGQKNIIAYKVRKIIALDNLPQIQMKLERISKKRFPETNNFSKSLQRNTKYPEGYSIIMKIFRKSGALKFMSSGEKSILDENAFEEVWGPPKTSYLERSSPEIKKLSHFESNQIIENYINPPFKTKTKTKIKRPTAQIPQIKLTKRKKASDIIDAIQQGVTEKVLENAEILENLSYDDRKNNSKFFLPSN